MIKLEKLDTNLFVPLSADESVSAAGGIAGCFIGYCIVENAFHSDFSDETCHGGIIY